MTTLVSLDDVKAELDEAADDTENDDELEDFISRASTILLNHPEYRIADVAGLTSYTEWADAGRDTVVLKHYPVESVTSVTEYNGSTTQVIAAEPVDGGTFTGYGWDYADGIGANGILIRLSGGSPIRWCGRRVKVVYTAGVASVPDDVRHAALEFVRHLWDTQRGAGTTRPEIGLDPDFDRDTVGVSGYLLPNRVTEALAAYRREPIVA